MIVELRPRGLTLTAYVLDGGIYEGIYRRMRQRHRAALTNIADVKLRERASHTDHTLGILCSLHKLSTAISWPTKRWLLDEQKDLSTLWIVCASPRHAFDIVTAWVPVVYKRVRWVRTPTQDEQDAMAKYWIALGLPTNLVDILVDLGLYWDPVDKVLELFEAIGRRENWEVLVHNTILAVLSFKPFRANRFAAIGTGSKRLFACWSVGLDHIIASALALKTTSRYYLGGYERLTPHLRRRRG